MKNFQNKEKIIKVSEVLRALAMGGIVIWAIALAASAATGIIMPLIIPNLSFDLTHFLTMPTFALALLVNLKIFRFLTRLKQGHFFDSQTVNYLNSAANWWLVLWIWEVAFYVLMQQPWKNPHDFSFYHFPPDTGGLFTALTLKFVSWFFGAAQELQEEQELTV